MQDKDKHVSKAAYEEGGHPVKVNWDEVPDPVDDSPEDDIVKLIKEEFPLYFISEHRFRGDRTVVINRDGLVEIITFLKNDKKLDFNFLMDLTAADYPGRENRFEVVYHLMSYSNHTRIRIKVPLSEKESKIQTISHLYETANWFEREVMEFFGITFKGHPEPKKLLLYDEFKGYPLRKDYAFDKRQPLIEYRDVGIEKHHYPGMHGSGTDEES